MVRLCRTPVGLSLLLIGMLLISRANCDSAVDDEEDEDAGENYDETSGNGAVEEVAERPAPDVNTYRDDNRHQQAAAPSHDDGEDESTFEETTVDSSASSANNQVFAGADDAVDNDQDADDNDLDEFSNEGPTEPAPPAAQPPPNQQSPTVFTYQNNRSKLLNIIKKPGILAGIVGGAIIGILTAILLIMFIVYRMRKKDEGSYALEETKKPLNAYDYRHCPTKEFYA